MMPLRPRYFVALLWHWSIPFLLGLSVGGLWFAVALTETLPEFERSFTRSIEAACSVSSQEVTP